MDRDRRWERTRLAYDAMVRGIGSRADDPVAAVQGRPSAGRDRRVRQAASCSTETGEPVAPMRDGDGVLCFNYRSDRMRQIVRALMIDGFDGFDVARPAPRSPWSR